MTVPDPAADGTVLAVATFRRNDLLAALLPELLAEARSVTFPVEVLVVDNDPDGEAREVVAACVGVRYHHEPRPGIAAARNAALDRALATGARALVFLDDDERPTTGWLRALHGHWRTSSAVVVAGPVRSRFDAPPDPWVLASGIFSRPRRTTGTALTSAATNNLLLDVENLREHAIRFDDAFGLTGGSDTLLTRELHARGASLQWCDEAEVTETVPSGRATRSFVLRRRFRTGTTWSRVHLTLRRRGLPTTYPRPVLIGRGLGRAGKGLAALVLARGRLPGHARACTDLATAAGMLWGAAGLTYVEYARRRGCATPAAALSTSRTPSA